MENKAKFAQRYNRRVYNDFIPDDGVISVLSSFAIQSHELFMELRNAGFDEEQALKIVVGLAHKEQARGTHGRKT